MNIYLLWLHVAKLRAAHGDIEGAKQARLNALIVPNRAMRRKFWNCRCWKCPDHCTVSCKIIKR